MLQSLPPELVLETLYYLPLQSLRSLQVTCKAWLEFIRANEGLIYHKAAVLHCFASPGSCSTDWDLFRAKTVFASHYVRDVITWKGFCADRFQLEKNWLGRGPSAIGTVPTAGSWVHRIKVDEGQGLVITTYAVGGLVVSDTSNRGVIWSLEPSYVRPYAHCEYSNGFLVFDQLGGFKEVWCLASRCPPGTQPEDSRALPDERQELASLDAANRHGTELFRPWALLQMPTVTHAFRFVWPTLLVSSQKDAFLFDIPTATLIQTIDISEPVPHGLRELNYVELSAEYIFICWRHSVCVFSRRDGALALSIDTEHTVDIGMLLQVDAYRPPASPRVPNAVMVPLQSVSRYTGSALPYRQTDEFIAVHVSPDGRDLAILGDPETVFFVQDFRRVIKKEIALAAVSTRLDFTSRFGHSLYHAFENGKVGLVLCSGIYVVTLDATHHGLASPTSLPVNGFESDTGDYSFPNISICRAMGFDDPLLLSQIDCLQMTDTGIYFVWEATKIPLRSSVTHSTQEAAETEEGEYEESVWNADDDVETEIDENEPFIGNEAVPQSPILTFINFAFRPGSPAT
ncbi:hypothetical protein NEOLEDRAFT_1178380 [Neolentinus lepideus HHB14362 ss-1]|uniref:F-box domain-containing protein n=1 Tax=Neolentinus lepideus HHB14362 ss-1 TaxID=1314782 RepID=A0A165SSB4_9AGAM|nr:hypothetical protein NEOLEDRAFT_1178380 [Neolentinus lepideus HHB14362 ss-1]